MSSFISLLLLVVVCCCLITDIQAQTQCALADPIGDVFVTDSLGNIHACLPDDQNDGFCVQYTSAIPTSTHPDVIIITPQTGFTIQNIALTAGASTSCASTTCAVGVTGTCYSCYPTSGTTMVFTISYHDATAGTTESDTFTVQVPSCVSTVGDPQFKGFRGQSYQIHGMDGVHYNLITSELTQVNAKFHFLSEGQCPIINGVPAINCWSHPGSYMGALGIQQLVDGVAQQLLIEAGSAEQGFALIEFNHAQVKVGQSMSVGSFSFNYTSSYSITVETGNFTLTIDNSDMFVNQGVTVNLPLSQLTCHGLLGQTHSMKIYPNQWRYVEGDVEDYTVSDIFAGDFVYNQFDA